MPRQASRRRVDESSVRAFARQYLVWGFGADSDVDPLDVWLASIAFSAGFFALADGIRWLWAVAALILCVPVVRWVRRERDPWGWGALEKESGRSARRFVRETASDVIVPVKSAVSVAQAPASTPPAVSEPPRPERASARA